MVQMTSAVYNGCKAKNQTSSVDVLSLFTNCHPTSGLCEPNLSQPIRIWYLSSRCSAQAQVILHIWAVYAELWLFSFILVVNFRCKHQDETADPKSDLQTH